MIDGKLLIVFEAVENKIGIKVILTHSNIMSVKEDIREKQN